LRSERNRIVRIEHALRIREICRADAWRYDAHGEANARSKLCEGYGHQRRAKYHQARTGQNRIDE